MKNLRQEFAAYKEDAVKKVIDELKDEKVKHLRVSHVFSFCTGA